MMKNFVKIQTIKFVSIDARNSNVVYFTFVCKSIYKTPITLEKVSIFRHFLDGKISPET